MAKNPAPSPSVPAATPTRLQSLLQRIAAGKERAKKTGVPWRCNQGMNAIPNRFHIDHGDGDVIAALKELTEQIDELIAEAS